jgi:mannose-1-phosphate guanylyltransferase
MKVNIMNNGNSVKLYVAILAGGSGTRLWPLSTPACPKPFVPLGPLGSLYGSTVARAQALGAERVFTVGSGALRHHCEMTGVEFLEEPGARNTAPAIALAGARAWCEAGGDGVLLVLPADHHIPEVEPFAKTLEQLSHVALAEEALGVMGMTPTGPEVSYGYIEQGASVGEGFRVARFIEKPDKAKAEALLLQGNVAWNSGMFLYPLKVLREEMALHTPGLWEAADAWLNARTARPTLPPRASRWTTRSWRNPPAWSSCPGASPGATWAPSRRSTSSCPRTRRATRAGARGASRAARGAWWSRTRRAPSSET